MLTVSFVLLLIDKTYPQNLFDDNADSIFRTVIGGIDETFSKLDAPDAFDRIREIEDSLADPANADSDILRGLKPEVSTQFGLPDAMDEGLTVEKMKIRMRKLYLSKLIDEEYSPMPDFTKNTDGTEHLTRRFRQIARSRSGNLRNLRRFGGNKGIRHSTPEGFDYDEFEGKRDYQRNLKNMTLALMEQFIYSTQYKLPFMLSLRNKYKSFYRYKIGYCFALLRLLQQQQRIIYSTLDAYYLQFNNLMIHLKLYEKVVRLDVDIKDLCAFIRLLNYRQKLVMDPDYYSMLDYTTPSVDNSTDSNSTDFTTPVMPDVKPGR